MTAIIFSVVVATLFTLWRDAVFARKQAEWLARERQREIDRLQHTLIETLEIMAERIEDGHETLDGDEWKQV